MLSLSRLALLLSALLLLPAAGAAPLTVRFTWDGVHACEHESPAFVVLGVPQGTVALRFEMHDLQAPKFLHGGGTVKYIGQPEIGLGAFRYNGPCPPPGTHHVYRWTVQALDQAGAVLAEGEVTRPFPPI